MTSELLQKQLDAATDELHARKSSLEDANKRVQDATADDIEAAEKEHETAASSFDEQAEEVARCKRNLEDAQRREKILADNPKPVRDAASAHVVSEPLTYSPESERSFFADAYAFQHSADPGARERLERNGREQKDIIRKHSAEKGYQYRDVGTAAFDGLTVPQYLIDLFAPLARAGAPTLAAVRKLPLPASGMTLSISRITTGAAAAAQASENSAVQETDIDDTRLDISVRTYAGQQDVSRQSLERSEMVDAVVFQDLIADYFTKLDDAILNGAGTSGTHKGVRNATGIVAVTYTDASPTVPELYPKVADCIQQIASNRYAPATTVFMHPRRWGWLTASLDGNNRALVVPTANGPFNALAVGNAPEYGAVVGSLQGLPVITDANLPTTNGAGTNEDVILIARVPDLLFWQEGDGMPRQFRFEQSNAPQSVRLAVWGYSAFTAERYAKASGVISGTGLVTPTF